MLRGQGGCLGVTNACVCALQPALSRELVEVLDLRERRWIVPAYEWPPSIPYTTRWEVSFCAHGVHGHYFYATGCWLTEGESVSPADKVCVRRRVILAG